MVVKKKLRRKVVKSRNRRGLFHPKVFLSNDTSQINLKNIMINSFDLKSGNLTKNDDLDLANTTTVESKANIRTASRDTTLNCVISNNNTVSRPQSKSEL